MKRRKFLRSGLGLMALGGLLATAPFSIAESGSQGQVYSEQALQKEHYTVLIKQLCSQETIDHIYTYGQSHSSVSINGQEYLLDFKPILWNDEIPSLHIVIYEVSEGVDNRIVSETSMGLTRTHGSSYTNPDLNLHLIISLDPV